MKVNGHLTRLVLFMLAATVALQAEALTNAWPEVPLYPSTPLPPLNQPKPATNVPANIVRSNSLTELLASSSTSTARSWPDALPPSKSNSVPATIPVIDPPATSLKAAMDPVGTTTNSNSSTNLEATGPANLDNSHVLEPGDYISFQVLEDKKDTYAEKDNPAHLLVTDSSEVDFPYV